ncbi:hypothetical protein BCR43DRAFT_481216 [Syncephalastrum racemosum]|uniref:Uncharacterized protein n=1 Tax=Syncephalastrum racemosum TaxID=13706 RepID=A0A1X2HRR7_SYNRA|nr:hypothetical protein BCR43DRAFT_481216 [Syncephalastrum racemosum]
MNHSAAADPLLICFIRIRGTLSHICFMSMISMLISGYTSVTNSLLQTWQCREEGISSRCFRAKETQRK